MQVAVVERPTYRQLLSGELGKCKAIKITFMDPFATKVRDFIYLLVSFCSQKMC